MTAELKIGTDTVTPAEAADLLGVSVKTTKRYIDQGKIDAARLSYKTIRIPRESVEALLLPGADADHTHAGVRDQPADVALARNVLAILDNDAADGRKIELLRELAARIINTKGSI
jgi:excisionase family DNA binding protein